MSTDDREVAMTNADDLRKGFLPPWSDWQG
jgi:hypothetical protein